MYIYFDTATYDEIERDVKVGEYVHNNHHRVCMKVTIEAQLGLIGGTMGLLTGFSILSGVEIIYYLIRFDKKNYYKIKIRNLFSSGSSCLSGSPGQK